MNRPNGLSPPGERTALWQPLTDAAREQAFRLQICGGCGTIQFPPREVCTHCLGDALEWRGVDPGGTVLAATRLHASAEPFFRAHVPFAIGSIKLDCGPVVLAYLDEGCRTGGSRVRVETRVDRSGQGVFVARPESLQPGSSESPISDPRLAEILGSN